MHIISFYSVRGVLHNIRILIAFIVLSEREKHLGK
jgi:hypothetical protein